MKNFNFLIILLLLLFTLSCKNNTISKTEKIQKIRNNVINVSNEINDVKTEILFGKCTLHIIDDILIINEMYPKGEKRNSFI